MATRTTREKAEQAERLGREQLLEPQRSTLLAMAAELREQADREEAEARMGGK